MERLRTERRVMTSFAKGAWAHGRDARFIPFVLNDIPLRLTRKVGAFPFVPSDSLVLNERCAEILDIQSSGLAKRLVHTQGSKCGSRYFGRFRFDIGFGGSSQNTR